MTAAWKMGLTRSIGVSNWNSTMMQDLVDAGLPLPALNQIQWESGFLEPGLPFTPYPHAETSASEYAWCTALSGDNFTILTVLNWICVGIYGRGALPSPVLAVDWPMWC